ncbi:hypothetical protein ABFS82_05G078700 [Erythranthe guttata]
MTYLTYSFCTYFVCLACLNKSTAAPEVVMVTADPCERQAVSGESNELGDTILHRLFCLVDDLCVA